MSVQKVCTQCGKRNLPDDYYCKECRIELKEYNPEDFVIIENLGGSISESKPTPRDSQFRISSYNVIICIVIFIGFLIFVIFVLISQQLVQAIMSLF
jgi:uncharacterized membrane protein YvbJ